MGNIVAVYSRQEFTITDEQQLIDGAHSLTRAGTDPDVTNSPVPGHEAFVKLLMEHGADELAELADAYGLAPGGSATLLVEERQQRDGAWLSKLPSTSGRIIGEIGDTGGAR